MKGRRHNMKQKERNKTDKTMQQEIKMTRVEWRGGGHAETKSAIASWFRQ
jgi:hypothetical protein